MALPENIPTTRQEVWALLKTYLEESTQDQSTINVLQGLLNQIQE